MDRLFNRSRAKTSLPWVPMRRLRRCFSLALPREVAIRALLGGHTNDTLPVESLLREKLLGKKWPVSLFKS